MFLILHRVWHTLAYRLWHSDSVSYYGIDSGTDNLPADSTCPPAQCRWPISVFPFAICASEKTIDSTCRTRYIAPELETLVTRSKLFAHNPCQNSIVMCVDVLGAIAAARRQCAASVLPVCCQCAASEATSKAVSVLLVYS